VKVLESGGSAAASTMERLREAQRRLELLHVSPEAILLCREEELLAPLLGWIGADPSLRPVVEELERSLGGTADGAFLSRTPAIFLDSPSTERRKVDHAAAPGFARWPETSAGEPNKAGRPATADEVRRILESLGGGDESMTTAWVESPPEGASSRGRAAVPSEAAGPGLSQRPGTAPGGFQEMPDAVTATDASRRLESRYGADERTARAWHQSVAPGPRIPAVDALLGEPGGNTARDADRPLPDPVSRSLQAAVDRALRVQARGVDRHPASPPALPPAAAAENLSRPAGEVPLAAESTGRTLGEAPRRSGLRRFAALGETIEAERVLPMPTPSPAATEDGPPRPSSVPWERDDLARQVADIFRREALRHGIVPEEDVP